jgi:hypothetical protein
VSESKRSLSIGDAVAILALMGGSLTTALPVNAITRSVTLLFALGGAVFLCQKLFSIRWKKIFATALVVIAYLAVVALLLELEAKASQRAAPTTTLIIALFTAIWQVPWRWVLPSAAITAGAVWFVARRRMRPDSDASSSGSDDLSLAEKRLREIVRNDKTGISGLVRLAGITYQPNFGKAHIDFVFSVFNVSIYDIAIDNKIKAGPIRFGEDWEPFHYEPKIASDEPIVCPARGGNFFVVRQPIRLEEIERFNTHEYIIAFFDLHIDFHGTKNFPEIETTRFDLTQRYLETRKGFVRFLDRLENIFVYSEEQWKALRNEDEIFALRTQVKALEERAQKYGLKFEIDANQTRMEYRGYSKDGEQNIHSSLIAANIRLSCSKVGDSKLAVRGFTATLLAAGESGAVVFLESILVNAYVDDSTKKRVDIGKGWTIDEPLTDHRVYEFLFKISDGAASLLTPRDHFVRVTMDAIGQTPQHIDFYVDNWEDAFKSSSGITLRRALVGRRKSA